MESALSALAAIFFGSSKSAYFNIFFLQKILYFDVWRQKRVLLALTGTLPVSLWVSMALCDSQSGSHCHSLAYSGPLWLTIAI